MVANTTCKEEVKKTLKITYHLFGRLFFLLYICPINLNIETMNALVNIFINGTWDTAHEDKTDKSPIRVFDKGTHVQILADQYDQYIDDLEERGYDCYLCLEMYAHPQWNGEIIFM